MNAHSVVCLGRRLLGTPLFTLLLPSLLSASVSAAIPAELGKEVSPETWEQTVTSLKGQYTLVTFWEVTCEPCIEEMPGLVEVFQSLHPKGLRVCAVNTDPESRFEAAASLLERLQLPFERYYKKPGSDVRFRQAIDPEYGANPFAVLFDPSGKKIKTFPEAQSKEEWLATLLPYFGKSARDAQAATVPGTVEEVDPFALLDLPGGGFPFGKAESAAPAGETGSSGSHSPFRIENPAWVSAIPTSGTLTVSVSSKQEAHLVLSTLQTEKIRGKGIHIGAATVSKRENLFMELRGENEPILRTPGKIFIPASWVEGEDSEKQLDIRLTFSGCIEGPKGMCFPPESHSIRGTLKKSDKDLTLTGLVSEWLDPRNPQAAPEEEPPTANTSPTVSTAKAASTSFLTKEALQDSSIVERAFARSLLLVFALAFLGGILTSFTPCVYPMIPATVAIFGAKEVKSRLAACSLAAVYVFGVAISYASLGVLAATIGTVFGTMMENPWLIGTVAAFYVILALSMLDVFVFYLPSSWVSAASKVNRKGYTGAFLMGLVSSIVFAPCGEPILLGILTWVAKTQSFFLGFWLLFVYAWGIGLLFFVIATFSSAIQYLPKAGSWMVAVKDFFGLLLLGLAVYWVHFVLPPAWLWGIATCYFLGVATFIHTKNQGLEGWSRTLFSFATLASLLFATLPLQRFALIQGWLPSPSVQNVGVLSQPGSTGISWLSGSPVSDLARARAMGKRVIVDYRTNVCVKCDEIEHYVFSNPDVQKALSDFVAIKVNLSEVARNKEVRELQQKREVYAVPVIEFYDSKGNLLEHKRIADFLSAEEFLKHIHDIG
jgi:thiol:disulfide interchange protein DsbD